MEPEHQDYDIYDDVELNYKNDSHDDKQIDRNQNGHELDLFEDFIVSNEKQKVQSNIDQLNSKIEELSKNLKSSEEKCSSLQSENCTLLNNINSLWKTACLQLIKQTNEIKKLKSRWDTWSFHVAYQKLSKDDFETTVSRVAAFSKEEFRELMKESSDKYICNCTQGPNGNKFINSKFTNVKANVLGTKIDKQDVLCVKSVLGRKSSELISQKKKIIASSSKDTNVSNNKIDKESPSLGEKTIISAPQERKNAVSEKSPLIGRKKVDLTPQEKRVISPSPHRIVSTKSFPIDSKNSELISQSNKNIVSKIQSMEPSRQDTRNNNLVSLEKRDTSQNVSDNASYVSFPSCSKNMESTSQMKQKSSHNTNVTFVKSSPLHQNKVDLTSQKKKIISPSLHRNVSKETSPEASKQTSAEASKQTSKGAPKKTCPEAPKETCPKAPKQTCPEAPKETCPEAPKETCPEAPKETCPEAPKETCPEGPKETGPEAPKKIGPEAPKKIGPEAPQKISPIGHQNIESKCQKMKTISPNILTNPRDSGKTEVLTQNEINLVDGPIIEKPIDNYEITNNSSRPYNKGATDNQLVKTCYVRLQSFKSIEETVRAYKLDSNLPVVNKHVSEPVTKPKTTFTGSFKIPKVSKNINLETPLRRSPRKPDRVIEYDERSHDSTESILTTNEGYQSKKNVSRKKETNIPDKGKECVEYKRKRSSSCKLNQHKQNTASKSSRRNTKGQDDLVSLIDDLPSKRPKTPTDFYNQMERFEDKRKRSSSCEPNQRKRSYVYKSPQRNTKGQDDLPSKRTKTPTDFYNQMERFEDKRKRSSSCEPNQRKRSYVYKSPQRNTKGQGDLPSKLTKTPTDFSNQIGKDYIEDTHKRISRYESNQRTKQNNASKSPRRNTKRQNDLVSLVDDLPSKLTKTPTDFSNQIGKDYYIEDKGKRISRYESNQRKQNSASKSPVPRRNNKGQDDLVSLIDDLPSKKTKTTTGFSKPMDNECVEDKRKRSSSKESNQRKRSYVYKSPRRNAKGQDDLPSKRTKTPTDLSKQIGKDYIEDKHKRISRYESNQRTKQNSASKSPRRNTKDQDDLVSLVDDLPSRRTKITANFPKKIGMERVEYKRKRSSSHESSQRKRNTASKSPRRNTKGHDDLVSLVDDLSSIQTKTTADFPKQIVKKLPKLTLGNDSSKEEGEISDSDDEIGCSRLIIEPEDLVTSTKDQQELVISMKSSKGDKAVKPKNEEIISSYIEEDTIDRILLAHQQRSFETLVNFSDDSEMSLLQFIDKKDPDKVAFQCPSTRTDSSINNLNDPNLPSSSGQVKEDAVENNTCKESIEGIKTFKGTGILTKVTESCIGDPDENFGTISSALKSPLKNDANTFSSVNSKSVQKLQLISPKTLTTSSCSPIAIATPLNGPNDVTSSETPTHCDTAVKSSTPIVTFNLDRKSKFIRPSLADEETYSKNTVAPQKEAKSCDSKITPTSHTDAPSSSTSVDNARVCIKVKKKRVPFKTLSSVISLNDSSADLKRPDLMEIAKLSSFNRRLDEIEDSYIGFPEMTSSPSQSESSSVSFLDNGRFQSDLLIPTNSNLSSETALQAIPVEDAISKGQTLAKNDNNFIPLVHSEVVETDNSDQNQSFKSTVRDPKLLSPTVDIIPLSRKQLDSSVSFSSPLDNVKIIRKRRNKKILTLSASAVSKVSIEKK